jgi:hypothetical protein
MRGKKQTVGEDLKEQERPPFEKGTVGEDLKEQEKARIRERNSW